MTEDTVKREPRYVGFWKRLAASIIDIIILVAIWNDALNVWSKQ